MSRELPRTGEWTLGMTSRVPGGWRPRATHFSMKRRLIGIPWGDGCLTGTQSYSNAARRSSPEAWWPDAAAYENGGHRDRSRCHRFIRCTRGQRPAGTRHPTPHRCRYFVGDSVTRMASSRVLLALGCVSTISRLFPASSVTSEMRRSSFFESSAVTTRVTVPGSTSL